MSELRRLPLAKMLYRIFKTLAIILAKILFRLEAKGQDNIPRSGGFILSSNHASYLDPILLGAACPRQLSFMARDDLFIIPIFGTMIRALGAFPLKRNFADITSIKEALRRLRQARGILLFPEGTRSIGGLSGKIEPGVAFVAAKSQVPVVPTFVKGSQKAFGRHARFIRPTKIEVYFGKPIHPNRSGFYPARKKSPNGDRDNYEDFARRIIQEIKRLGQTTRD